MCVGWVADDAAIGAGPHAGMLRPAYGPPVHGLVAERHAAAGRDPVGVHEYGHAPAEAFRRPTRIPPRIGRRGPAAVTSARGLLMGCPMTPGGRKTLVWAVAALAAAVLLLLLLSDVMTLEQLKARREQLLAIIHERPVVLTTVFILAFALIAAFAPGAAVLKVAAGALFGLGGGFAVAQTATVLAAALGFIVARYLGRHWVERRFHGRVQTINRGVRREGVAFLLALRLNPLVPFFLINMGMGLTRMRLWVFVATSFFGLVPASLVYSNAGTELARIESPADILTVRLIGSLILLSLLPLAGRWAAKRVRRRAVAALPREG